MDRQQVTAAYAAEDAGCAPDEDVPFRATAEADDDPFPGGPAALGLRARPVSLVRPACLDVLVDPVREPEQGPLAQRVQVGGPEVVGHRRVDLIRRIDPAFGKALAQ